MITVGYVTWYGNEPLVAIFWQSCDTFPLAACILWLLLVQGLSFSAAAPPGRVCYVSALPRHLISCPGSACTKRCTLAFVFAEAYRCNKNFPGKNKTNIKNVKKRDKNRKNVYKWP